MLAQNAPPTTASFPARALLGATLLLAGTAALAQTAPNLGTTVTAIPTLSEWGTIPLAALLAFAGIRALRHPMA